jgi:hypothetical protein
VKERDYSQVRDALVEIHGPNSGYCTASRIAELTDYRPQYVGIMLKEKGRPKGDVRPWRGNSSSGTLWKITIDESQEVTDDSL